MTGKDLLIGLGDISHKYYEEAEKETIASRQGHKTLRRPLLIAAVVGLFLLLVGCGAVIYLTLAEEPWSSIPRVEGSAVPREDIHITITGVSPGGLGYHCDLEGFGTEEKSVLFYMDAPCVLERKTDGGWTELSQTVTDDQWNAREILTDGHYDGSVFWAGHYGYLDVGEYRVTVPVLEGHEAFTLEFEITEEMRTEDLELAEELVNREFWHVRETYRCSYGSLDNVPEEAKEQYTRPYEGDDDAMEYWKCGDDYLCLNYDGDTVVHGMMFKNGVKYKLAREWESNDAPIVGWTPWPDLDLDRLTAWKSTVGSEVYGKNPTYREDGTIEKLVLTSTVKDNTQWGVEVTYTTILEFQDDSREAIARLLEEQDTNVWQAFSWEEDRSRNKALETAFVNTTPNPIQTADEAIALADKERTVEYTQIMVYRDEQAGIWKIEYQILYGYQGYQYVYLNDDGITVMISGAGSKVEEWKEEYPDP